MSEDADANAAAAAKARSAAREMDDAVDNVDDTWDAAAADF